MTKRKRGRPTKYNKALVNKICKRLVEGESLRSICRDKKMPGISNVILWLGKYEYFREQYAIARENQADTLADEILDIADDGRNDWMESQDPDNPGYKFNGEHYQRSRLRVDVRKWAASKLKPKKYGDRLKVGGEGDDGEILLKIIPILGGNSVVSADDSNKKTTEP